MAWVTLQDRRDYWATQTLAAVLPVRVSTATHTHTVSLKHGVDRRYGHTVTHTGTQTLYCIYHFWFQPYWKEHPFLCCLPQLFSSFFSCLSLLSSSFCLFLSFSLPHLFSISCGLDSWRQKSPHPSSFLGVRPLFSTQTNNTACERLCLLEKHIGREEEK